MSETSTGNLSIGALSRATGISTNTIRTWERRYGMPQASRTSGGHRVYAASTVERLALVQQALDRGHRPGQVLPLDAEALRRLLGLTRRTNTEPPVDVVATWVELARQIDPEGLERAFHHQVAEVGLRTFVKDYVPLFVQRLGEAWEKGSLRVYHEHLASERLRDFLVASWWPLNRESSAGDTVICAALPGERHFLGLHLVACLAAVAGVRCLFLGLDTPVEELVACAERTRPRALLVSCSVFSDHERTAAQLAELAAGLPLGVQLVVGGAGAPAVEGAEVMRSLDALERWLDA